MTESGRKDYLGPGNRREDTYLSKEKNEKQPNIVEYKDRKQPFTIVNTGFLRHMLFLHLSSMHTYSLACT